MTQTILLAGATGMLGSRIAHHLQLQPDTRLRLLVREAESEARQAKLKLLLQAGAEVIEGDVADAGSLDRATQGVEVVVSALQGGPEVIIDGQAALAAAAKRNGAARMVPSDFGLDIFKAGAGEHPFFNWRQEADRRIAEIGLPQVNILQGAFMDLFGPGSPMIDYEAGVISFWGDGKRPIEVTTVEDTARITALAATDRDLPPGKFSFWGDRLSFADVADVIESQTGRRFEQRSLGDEAALRAAMASSDQQTAGMLAYSLYMLNGQTALDANDAETRYPAERLQSFADMLAQRLEGAAN